MGFFASLPADASVRHATALNKRAGRALVSLHAEIMPSALPAAGR